MEDTIECAIDQFLDTARAHLGCGLTVEAGDTGELVLTTEAGSLALSSDRQVKLYHFLMAISTICIALGPEGRAKLLVLACDAATPENVTS